ncbi:hypothetical protein [Nostoc sp.]|uniref:hypothetical protein n=1 Tax=Nostoc sp. TaxID=1180 RepID=UPI002FF70722
MSTRGYDALYETLRVAGVRILALSVRVAPPQPISKIGPNVDFCCHLLKVYLSNSRLLVVALSPSRSQSLTGNEVVKFCVKA